MGPMERLLSDSSVALLDYNLCGLLPVSYMVYANGISVCLSLWVDEDSAGMMRMTKLIASS